MTEEEAKNIASDERMSVDVENEYTTEPDPDAVGISAYHKLLRKIPKMAEASEYRVVVPCCRCGNCVIIREMRLGQIVNVGYGCTIKRFSCEAYGTCKDGRTGKRGPMVLVRKLSRGEGATDFSRLPGEVWSVDDGRGAKEEKEGARVVGEKEVPRGFQN